MIFLRCAKYQANHHLVNRRIGAALVSWALMDWGALIVAMFRSWKNDHRCASKGERRLVKICTACITFVIVVLLAALPFPSSVLFCEDALGKVDASQYPPNCTQFNIGGTKYLPLRYGRHWLMGELIVWSKLNVHYLLKILDKRKCIWSVKLVIYGNIQGLLIGGWSLLGAVALRHAHLSMQKFTDPMTYQIGCIPVNNLILHPSYRNLYYPTVLPYRILPSVV